MKTLSEYVKQAEQEFKKIKETIQSCKTRDQLIAACKMYTLWQEKYEKDISEIKLLLYWDGILTGNLQAMDKTI